MGVEDSLKADHVSRGAVTVDALSKKSVCVALGSRESGEREGGARKET